MARKNPGLVYLPRRAGVPLFSTVRHGIRERSPAQLRLTERICFPGSRPIARMSRRRSLRRNLRLIGPSARARCFAVALEHRDDGAVFAIEFVATCQCPPPKARLISWKRAAWVGGDGCCYALLAIVDN